MLCVKNAAHTHFKLTVSVLLLLSLFLSLRSEKCWARETIKLKRTKQKSIYLFIVLVIVCFCALRFTVWCFDYAMFILICCTWTSEYVCACACVCVKCNGARSRMEPRGEKEWKRNGGKERAEVSAEEHNCRQLIKRKATITFVKKRRQW